MRVIRDMIVVLLESRMTVSLVGGVEMKWTGSAVTGDEALRCSPYIQYVVNHIVISKPNTEGSTKKVTWELEHHHYLRMTNSPLL